ncbi:MAG TPA: hypothetical protein VNM14_09690 [Planctomycetota bacterium]|nr:hypothetical protein [Planctomycetota bacterium]
MTEQPRARILPPLAILLIGIPILATAYEFILVAIETYGYTLSARSSRMIFVSAVPAVAAAFLLKNAYLKTISAGRLLRPAAWMSMGIAGGSFFLYWAWAADRWLRLGMMGNEGASFSLSPAVLVEYLTRFHEQGLWGWGPAWYYDHTTMKGSTLTFWWSVEAFLFLVVPSRQVWKFLKSHPVCDGCGSWMWIQEGARRMQASRETKVQEAIRSGDLAPLEEPDRPQKGDPFTLRIDLTKCDLCPDAVYLTLVSDRKVLLRMHPIPANQLQKVYKSARPKAPKPPPPPPPSA